MLTLSAGFWETSFLRMDGWSEPKCPAGFEGPFVVTGSDRLPVVFPGGRRVKWVEKVYCSLNKGCIDEGSEPFTAGRRAA